jgi:hypothetical protein
MKPKSKSRLQRLLDRLLNLFRPRPEPEDPFADKMAPIRRPRPGRSGAAVAELEEDGN